MAVYVSAGSRRRRTVLSTAAALAVGLILGVLVGRTTAPDVHDAISDSQHEAGDAAAALARLPLEYEQSVGTNNGETSATILAALDAARDQVHTAFDDSPWLTNEDRTSIDRLLDAVDDAARRGVPAAQFDERLDAATSALASTFAITVDAGLR